MNLLAKINRLAVVALALCCTPTWALQLTDIHYPMKRSEADTTLSKDYTFEMLTDGTVRRTWQLPGKKVVIDFDTTTEDLVMAAIVYDTPVSKKEGIEDAHTIAAGRYDENATWDSPKDKKAKLLVENTYGLRNARRKKLADKAVLFYEMNDQKSKIVRVSLFTSMPHTNRWALTRLTGGGKKTAMGTQMSTGYVEQLYKDEERRQAIAPTAAEPKKVATADSKPHISVTVTTRTKNKPSVTARPAKPTAPTPVAATPPAPKPVVHTAAAPAPAQQIIVIEREQAPLEDVLPPAPDWLKAVGIERPTWWHYLALAIIALIIVVYLLSLIFSGSKKEAQRKRFEDIANNTDDD